jgi:hypothetical protein
MSTVASAMPLRFLSKRCQLTVGLVITSVEEHSIRVKPLVRKDSQGDFDGPTASTATSQQNVAIGDDPARTGRRNHLGLVSICLSYNIF